MAFNNIVHTNNGACITFEMHDVDVAIVNSLRRTIISEIPNVAIGFDPYNPEHSDINFIKNTSSLHNEFMGHRISLIPLFLEQHEIQNYSPSNYKFEIHVKNTTNSMINVTTDDIKVFDANGKHIPELTTRMFPHDSITNDPILITKLKPNMYNVKEGEELHVEFYARKGIGKMHSRWFTTSTCTFSNMIDEERMKEARKALKASVADQNEQKKMLNAFDTLHKYRFFKTNEYDESNAFIFIIESDCKLSPRLIMKTAFDVLIRKFEELDFDIETNKDVDDMFLVKIKNEDHTVGNLMTSLMYNFYVRENKRVDYVGYYQPHPLENDIVIKIKLSHDEDVSNFINEAKTKVIETLTNLQKEWIVFAKVGA